MSNRKANRPIIAVVGHLVKDEIIDLRGQMTTALGGIAYNLAALAAVMEKGRYTPVCRLGYDVRKGAISILGQNTAFDPSAVSYSNRPNVVNRLVYRKDGLRDEWNSRRPSPLSLEKISADTDVVLFNFISGNDVRLRDISGFKKSFRGITYCDFHSLALGRDSAGKRYFRRHPRWKKYLSSIDFVQMNLYELQTICRKRLVSKEEMARACGMLHKAGPPVAMITLAARGMIISVSSTENAYYLPPVQITKEIDPTGCGDTFAAVFIYRYALSGDLMESVREANRWAAAKATFSGLEGFNRIKEILNSIGPPTDPVILKL